MSGGDVMGGGGEGGITRLEGFKRSLVKSEGLE